MKKSFSLVVSVALIAALFPLQAWAEENDGSLDVPSASGQDVNASVDSDFEVGVIEEETIPDTTTDDRAIDGVVPDEALSQDSTTEIIDVLDEESDSNEAVVPDDGVEDVSLLEEEALAPQDSARSLQEDAPDGDPTICPPAPLGSVTYKAHVQNIGWQKEVADGKTAGTSGRALRVEALQIKVEGAPIEYATHVQNIGWQGYVKSGETAGTTGRSLRVEAIKIRLTDSSAMSYDIYYRVHVQNFGWLGWAKNGSPAGSVSYGYRMEAIQIKLVKKGDTAPGSTKEPLKEKVLTYQTHVQNVGWQATKTNGTVSGTSGRSLRVEALKINLNSSYYAGSVQYQTYVQNEGWQNERTGGQIAGSTGKNQRIEALRIRLTGDISEKFDIYYRVHVQNFGWLGWTKNGADSGSAGLSMRVEALQIKLVAKGTGAPGKTEKPFITCLYEYQAKIGGTTDFQASRTDTGIAGTLDKDRYLYQIKAVITDSPIEGGISYATHLSGVGWTKYSTNGNPSGTGTNKIEALRFGLLGDMGSYFDVYYRVYSKKIGWLGWTKNGASAGTTGYGYGVEAYQLKIVPKGGAAPGSTASAFVKSATGDYGLDKDLARIAAANGNDLRRCFNYVAGFRYISQSLYPTGNWKVPFAKEMIANNGGNCYRSAALFCCLAEYLGYDARVVSGALPSRSQGRAPHGWVEIRKNGTVYVCDPEIVEAYPSYNWYMITYANAPVTYLR